MSGKTLDRAQEDNRLLLLKMSIKCSDVGHSAKALSQHLKWTERIIEEFYQQGDEERKHGLPVSPFMDRYKDNVPKAQVGFLDFLVLPMYEAWSAYLDLPETVIPCVRQIKANRAHWNSLVLATPSTAANAAAAAGTPAAAAAAGARRASAAGT